MASSQVVTNPMPLDIRCPACGARAAWNEAFVHTDRKGIANLDPRTVHPWGQRFMVERYPSVMKWTPEGNGKSHALHKRGVMQCSNCHRVAAHTLDWSTDAYYRWDIRGTPMWAWNKAHALDILHFIESKERAPEKYAYRYWLRRMPAGLITAKVRDLIVKRIRTTFAQE